MIRNPVLPQPVATSTARLARFAFLSWPAIPAIRRPCPARPVATGATGPYQRAAVPIPVLYFSSRQSLFRHETDRGSAPPFRRINTGIAVSVSTVGEPEGFLSPGEPPFRPQSIGLVAHPIYLFQPGRPLVTSFFFISASTFFATSADGRGGSTRGSEREQTPLINSYCRRNDSQCSHLPSVI